MTSPDTLPDGLTALAEGCRLHVLLLAGNWRVARHAALSQTLGLPPAVLPIDAASSVIDLWMTRIAALADRATLGIAMGSSDDARLYRRQAGDMPVGVEVIPWTDLQQHRGAGGTVRDYVVWWEARSGARLPGILVIEGSAYPTDEASAMLREIAGGSDRSLVAMTRSGDPCGLIYLTREAVDRVPSIGYYDLKEQLIPALHSAGMPAHPVLQDFKNLRLSDRESYLRIISARARNGAAMVAPTAEVHPRAKLDGVNLIGPSCRIGAGAIVSNSAIHVAAVVDEDAVVARSVIPPGVRVPRGATVVDQVFAPLGVRRNQ